MFLPPGSVLVSRCNNEALNTSPGYWNHLCIALGNDQLVESQEDEGVILTSFDDYQQRDYTWGPLYPQDQMAGIRAASQAKDLIGLPYRRVVGIFHFPFQAQRGMNCVLVVRASYRFAYNRDFPELRIPDNIESLIPRILTKDRPSWVFNN